METYLQPHWIFGGVSVVVIVILLYIVGHVTDRCLYWRRAYQHLRERTELLVALYSNPKQGG